MAGNRFVRLNAGQLKEEAAPAASTGTAQANCLVSTGSEGTIDPSFFPTGFGPEANTFVADGAIPAGAFVNIFDNAGVPSMRLADPTNGRPADGFVMTAVADSASGTVFFEGINDQLSGLNTGTQYYLSDTPGDPTDSTGAPVTGGNAGDIVQQLGRSISPTAIYFERSQTVELC